MAIVTKKPTASTSLPPNPPRIHSQNVKVNVVDTKYNPVSSLITSIEGSKWIVDYYSQVIDRDNALYGQDIGQSGVYQQYKLIKGLEFKVANELSTSQEDESKAMIVQGSAHVHSMIIANHGDVFIADVGDGRAGVFQITMSEKKSMYTQAVYYVEYTLLYFVDAENTKKKDLDDKVVETYYYLKDFVNYGQNPLVITSEYEAFLKLHDLQEDLIDAYFKWFFSVEKKTLLVPGQTHLVYDHFMTKFVLSLIDSMEHNKIRYTRIYNVDGDAYLEEPTILDAIIKRDKYMVPMLNRKMGLASKLEFNNDPMMEGFRFANIPLIVYPKIEQPIFESVTPIRAKTITDIALQDVSTRIGDLNSILPINIADTLDAQLPDLPNIVPVLQDDCYIFTNTFYEGQMVSSQLEWIVHKFLNEKIVNASEVFEVSKNFINWGGLERFYYIPVIIAMIKYIFRS